MASKQILSLAAATACRFMCLYLFMPFALYTTMLCPTSAAKEHSLVRQFTGSLGTSSVQSDAQALINFMRESDPSGVLKLRMSLQNPWVNASDHCSWFGVICRQGRVWKLVVENLKLNGTFPSNTLSRLEGLQVLSLKGNMLTGTIPVDLALVGNLKILYLNENRFSGEIPAVFSTFHRLNVLNLANNNLTGPIPTAVCAMPVRDLILQDNQLSGDIPDNVMATNFNVSNNNLSGPIPPNLAAKYMSTSFEGNLYLCGKPLNTSCSSQNASAPARTAFPSGAKSPSSGTNETLSALPPIANSNKGGLSTDKIAAIVVCSVVVLIVVTFMAFVIYWRSKYGTSGEEKPKRKRKLSSGSCSGHFSGSFSTQFSGQLPGQFSAQVAPEGEEGSTRVCNLILFEGDDKAFGLEDLLRASAQMLGKGSIGTAYKVTLEGGHSVAVKRLRNMKNMSRKNFEHQLEVIRKLVHPNVAPLRAYYHTPEEKLLVFDYYPNGNLFSILHLKHPSLEPLDWTGRLKIARGVARGLAFLHETIKLPHGNLKASNVLLDCNGEPRIADFGLAPLTNNTSATGNQIAGYRAPECAQSRRMTQKVDVYAFGILILEILTGRKPTNSSDEIDLPQWVNSLPREEVIDKDMGQSSTVAEEDKLVLLDVALKCIAFNPEKRPKMSRALEYIELLHLPEDPSDSFCDISAVNVALEGNFAHSSFNTEQHLP